MKVKEISSTKLPDISIKRVAAYARVSVDKEEALHSLSAQVSYYNEMISNHLGWELAGIYADEGISGTLNRRPEFQRMLADCRSGKIDQIITKSVSRFARNTVTLLETMRELKALGIDIYFENEKLHSISEGGDFMIRLLALIAEEYSRSASENTKWKIRKKFEAGQANGNSPALGFRWKSGYPYIVPEQAIIVRQIFGDFLSGMRAEDIADKLNTQGIKTLKGKRWKYYTIQKVLNNVMYMGDMILQKTYSENYRTKRTLINNGKLRKYYIESYHNPIISREEFQAVRKEAAWRKTHKMPIRPPYETKFTGLVRCAECGQNFWRTLSDDKEHARTIWRCSSFWKNGKAACSMRALPEQLIISLAQMAFGIDSLAGVNLRDHVEQIICGQDSVIFKLKNGQEKYVRQWRF